MRNGSVRFEQDEEQLQLPSQMIKSNAIRGIARGLTQRGISAKSLFH
jgi:hypothetical protein